MGQKKLETGPIRIMDIITFLSLYGTKKVRN